jgi:LAO/AO transport system kinase
MTLLGDDPSLLADMYQAMARIDGLAPDRMLLPRLLVGVTGPPGSGKSTLTDGLVREFRLRCPDCRLGVVAVDPSSPFTGGAVLGDRVRMMRHATDPMVFVRSMASRGHLGGLALGVKGVIRVMGLLGCEVVLLETVGVGQSEVEIASVADVVMIVMAPGQGDSVQLLKAGLMEIGDLFVVNKADRPDAGRLHGELVTMLRLARPDATASVDDDEESAPLLNRRPGTLVEPATFLVSAEQGAGVAALAEALDALGRQHGERWQQRRREAVEDDIREAVLEEAARRIRVRFRAAEAVRSPVKAILEGTLTVDQAAEEVLRGNEP